MVGASSLLQAVLVATISIHVSSFSGWIDPDTSSQNYERQSFVDGNKFELIMSDEFNREGRSFKDGHDPMWTGLDKSDDDQTAQGKKSLQYYNSSHVETRDGKMVITTTTESTKWRGFNPFTKKYETMEKTFRSGMAQTWNKFCFTGGMIEVDVQFPGAHDIGGLWPAVWLLGNLGRATFEASTNLMWPWSYSKCNRKLQRAQEISGCDITTHFDLNKNQGRGATEIDLIEVMPGPPNKLPLVKEGVHRPYSSMTLQLAPGIPASEHRPQPGTLPEWGFTWYDNITYGANSSVNPFFYGTYLGETHKNEPVPRAASESYQCDALGAMVQLNESHFDSLHTFRLEWQPGADGYIRWYMDGEFRFGIDAAGLEPYGTQIPNEPSYVILNTAISTSWGFPNPPTGCTAYDCKTPEGQCGMNPGFCKTLPAEYLIDYVRVYQNKNDSRQTIGCNPKDYPTTKFIAGHEYRYKRLNDVHPLKAIVTGGAACAATTQCGEGVCSKSRCKCFDGWQGPNCLVPTYSNDFPDWEVPDWRISMPYIPVFLRYAALALLVVVIGMVSYFAMYKNTRLSVLVKND